MIAISISVWLRTPSSGWSMLLQTMRCAFTISPRTTTTRQPCCLARSIARMANGSSELLEKDLAKARLLSLQNGSNKNNQSSIRRDTVIVEYIFTRYTTTKGFAQANPLVYGIVCRKEMTVLIYSCLCTAEREEILHWDTQENLAGAYGWVRQKVRIWCDRLLCQALSESGSAPWKGGWKISSSNMIEKLNRAIRRRTSVVGIFPNESSYVRMVATYLMEYAEDWSVSRAYISHESIAATLTTVA